MPRVFIPAALRHLAGDAQQVQVEGANVRQVIQALDRRFPGIAEHLLDDDGRLATGLTVCIDGSVSSRGLHTAVGPQSEVHFLPAISGG